MLTIYGIFVVRSKILVMNKKQFPSELNLVSLSLSKCNIFKKNFILRNLPNLPSRKDNSTQWPMFRSDREYMQTCAFFKKNSA